MSLVRNAMLLSVGCAVTGLIGPSVRLVEAQSDRAERRGVVASSQSPAEQIAGLVRDLGAPKYSVRERASVRLLDFGTAAAEQLSQVPRTAPLEQRQRAAVLLARIRVETFERTATEFLTDNDPARSYGLPAWEKFRQCVGSSRTSKLLFLDAVRCQTPLLECVQDFIAADVLRDARPENKPDPKSSDRDLATQTTRQDDAIFKREITLQTAAQVAGRLQRQQLTSVSPRLGDFVALLLVAASVDVQVPVVISETLETSVHRYVFMSYLQKQGYGTCLRRLMNLWVPKTHDAMAPRIMQVALEHDLKSITSIARMHLKPNSDLQTRCTALQCITRFGDATDIPLVKDLFTDDAIVLSLLSDDVRYSNGPQIDESYSAPPGFEGETVPTGKRMLTVQVCDLALVAAVSLSGGDPKEYFPGLRETGNYGVDTRSIATPADNAEVRSQRIKGWLASRKSQQTDN